jgi:hypothetical protein
MTRALRFVARIAALSIIHPIHSFAQTPLLFGGVTSES